MLCFFCTQNLHSKIMINVNYYVIILGKKKKIVVFQVPCQKKTGSVGRLDVFFFFFFF